MAKNPKELHKLAKKSKPGKLTPPAPPKEDLILNAVGEKLRERLKTKVNVQQIGKSHGKITLEYYGDEELERIIALLLPGAEF